MKMEKHTKPVAHKTLIDRLLEKISYTHDINTCKQTEIHMVIEIHMHMSRGVHVYEQRKQMYMNTQIDAYECKNIDAYL